jgi:hypothetical protein
LVIQFSVAGYYGGQFHCAVPARLYLDSNLHSPERRLIELRIEHADLDAVIDAAALQAPTDELMLRRLKKRRLRMRDDIARLEAVLRPREPA